MIEKNFWEDREEDWKNMPVIKAIGKERGQIRVLRTRRLRSKKTKKVDIGEIKKKRRRRKWGKRNE